MIERTYFSAKGSKLIDYLAVATDDERIAQAVRDFGGDVIMTGDQPTGTDRAWEAINKLETKYEIVANIQGDQPCVDPVHIDSMIAALIEAGPDVPMSACAAPIKSEADAVNRGTSKVVLDVNNFAIYYSRSLIPHTKDGKYNPNTQYLKNCGMYCFRRDFLGKFASLPMGPLQASEDLEQLKTIENGYRIKVARVDSAARGVDYPHDVALLEKEMIENVLK